MFNNIYFDIENGPHEYFLIYFRKKKNQQLVNFFIQWFLKVKSFMRFMLLMENNIYACEIVSDGFLSIQIKSYYQSYYKSYYKYILKILFDSLCK